MVVQSGLYHTWLETPKTGFLVTQLLNALLIFLCLCVLSFFSAAYMLGLDFPVLCVCQGFYDFDSKQWYEADGSDRRYHLGALKKPALPQTFKNMEKL